MILRRRKGCSEAPSNLLTDSDLAREVVQSISDFDLRLIDILKRAKEIEPLEEYEKFKRAVGEVLSSTGFALAYPIYRRHKQLVPDALKGEIL